mgnify:FL=1
MLSTVKTGLERLYSIFEISSVTQDMEKFIVSNNPQTISDVENLEKQYDTMMKRNFSFFS